MVYSKISKDSRTQSRQTLFQLLCLPSHSPPSLPYFSSHHCRRAKSTMGPLSSLKQEQKSMRRRA